MSKTLKTVTLGSTLAIAFLATNAKADEVARPESSQQAQPIATEVAPAPTAENVKDAQRAVDGAKVSVTAQEVLVKTVTETQQAADQAYREASEQVNVAENLVSQATAEAIQKAEATIVAAKTDVKTKTAAIQPAQETVEQAQAKVNAQAKLVEAAKAVTAKEAADVSLAHAQVKEAEAAFDSTNLLKAQQEAGRLETKVANDQKAVADLTANLSAKEQEQANLQATGRTKRQELEAAVIAAGPEVLTEVVERELARHEVSEYESVSTPKEPTFVGRDSKTYYVTANENVIFDGEKTETIVLTNKDAYTSKTVDYKKVSQYIRDYIAEIRRINGIDIPVPEVTEAALKWAKARTDEMAKNDELSHDTVLRVADFGLTGETENASRNSLPVTSNLDEKEIAYNEVLSYFNDFSNASSYGSDTAEEVAVRNYGHRIPLLAASGTGFAVEATNGYGILTFVSDKSNNVYDTLPSVLDESVYGTYEYNGETRKYAPYSSYFLAKAENKDADSQRSEFYFNGKRIKFLPKTTFRYVWEESLYHKNTKREAAVAALNAFNSQQATAEQAISTAISSLSADLATAKTSLAKDEQDLSTANERVATLTADDAEKVRVLKEAQANLTIQEEELAIVKAEQAKSEAELTRLSGLRDKAQEGLDKAKAALSQAQESVLKAEQALLELQNAPATLAAAKDKQAKVLEALDQAKTNLALELERLAALQAELATKQANYVELKAKFEAELEVKRQAIIGTGQLAEPIKTEEGTVIDYRPISPARQQFEATIRDRFNFQVTKAVTQSLPKSSHYQAKLPETGTETAYALSLLGIGLLGLTGLASKSRRNS